MILKGTQTYTHISLYAYLTQNGTYLTMGGATMGGCNNVKMASFGAAFDNRNMPTVANHELGWF